MTRPRALLSLSLITLGAMLGGLGLSGYYEPRPPHGQPRAVSIATSMPAAASQLAPKGRLRFVAVAEDKPQSAAVARSKAAAKAPPPAPKPKAESKERSEPKVKRPQQAAAPWPWSMFSN